MNVEYRKTDSDIVATAEFKRHAADRHSSADIEKDELRPRRDEAAETSGARQPPVAVLLDVAIPAHRTVFAPSPPYSSIARSETVFPVKDGSPPIRRYCRRRAATSALVTGSFAILRFCGDVES